MSVATVLQRAEEAVARKTRVMEERKREDEKIRDRMRAVDDNGDVKSSGCGVCALFWGRARYAAPRDAVLRNKATTQLTAASEQLQARCGDLESRISQARANAVALNANGKKVEALAALRRSKTLEKQLYSSQNALETLEAQILMLEEAKLQADISSALTASTGAVKKKTKGLVEKTEKAVDAAAEVRDIAEDVTSAMDGLRPVDHDEDELMAELASMVEAPPTVRGVAAADATQHPHNSATITVSFPTVPKTDTSAGLAQKTVERVGLLAGV